MEALPPAIQDIVARRIATYASKQEPTNQISKKGMQQKGKDLLPMKKPQKQVRWTESPSPTEKPSTSPTKPSWKSANRYEILEIEDYENNKDADTSAKDDLLQERTELSPQIPQNTKEQQDPRERTTPPKAQTPQATEYLKQFEKVVTSEEGLARWMDETRDILERTKLTPKRPQDAKERRSLHREASPPKM